jgi:hypothetical protein
MVSDNTFTLIKKKYCSEHLISLPNDLVFSFFKIDPVTGNGVFFIDQAGKPSLVYSPDRMDLSGYSAHRSLDIPASDRNTLNSNPSPDVIASWVNRFTNIDLLGEDISKLSMSSAVLTVIISPNSMRFKNSFQINRL